MMWRLAVTVGLLCGMVQVAMADESAAVLNDPPSVATVKDVVNRLHPTVETIYEVERGEWEHGVSGSLYNFTSSNIHLGRIKAGYLSTNTIYGGVDVDVVGIATRYLGGKWGQLDTVLGVVDKYAAVGYILGYDLEGDQFAHGPSFGASIRF